MERVSPVGLFCLVEDGAFGFVEGFATVDCARGAEPVPRVPICCHP